MKELAKRILRIIEIILYSIFRVIIVREMKLLNRTRIYSIVRTETPWDFIRYSSLELVAYEINKKQLVGNVAEVGVFKGEFASKINRCFSKRKLYLFDTFYGLDEKDLNRDKKNELIFSNRIFNYPNIQNVLKKMKYPKNCIIRKGYFPKTIDGLEGNFVFVSLDADLYNPIYEGLKYFYPRLVKGGYIFVHDYNNFKFGGAKEATLKFSEEEGISYFPLSDVNGTAVFIK